MMKINKHIEIVGSSNPRLNAMPEDSQAKMLRTLKRHYTRVGVTTVDTLSDLEKLASKQPDLVVLGRKSILLDPAKSSDDSPRIWLSDYLKQRDIAFTGSGATALMLQFDKPAAKQAVMDAGFCSAAFFISHLQRPTYNHNLSFPLFVKPASLGGSKGIDERSVVYTQSELESKIMSIHSDFSSDALVEEYLSGREFTVAIVKHSETGRLRAMPVEITPPQDKKGNRFLSKAVKKADTEQVVALDDSALQGAVSALAIGVFKALGSRDYGRIDVRLDAAGTPNFIEANLMPGLSDHGYLARCFSINEHIAYDDMILSIVKLGLDRSVSPLTIAPSSRKNYSKRFGTPADTAEALA